MLGKSEPFRGFSYTFQHFPALGIVIQHFPPFKWRLCKLCTAFCISRKCAYKRFCWLSPQHPLIFFSNTKFRFLENSINILECSGAQPTKQGEQGKCSLRCFFLPRISIHTIIRQCAVEEQGRETTVSVD